MRTKVTEDFRWNAECAGIGFEDGHQNVRTAKYVGQRVERLKAQAAGGFYEFCGGGLSASHSTPGPSETTIIRRGSPGQARTQFQQERRVVFHSERARVNES